MLFIIITKNGVTDKTGSKSSTIATEFPSHPQKIMTH